MTVTYTTYREDKTRFLKKHHNDFTVETSPMDEYSCYHKLYICADGAQWTECYGPSWESTEVEVEIKGVKVRQTIEVKMLRTEYWSTDNANSKYYYERY